MNPSETIAGRLVAPAARDHPSRLGRWLHPRGRRAVGFSLFLMALILGVSGVVYETGGTSFASLHLMYLPILLAGAAFGIYGGMAAALAAGLALGPHMPMNIAEKLPQTTSNWIFRIGFFLLIGVFSGLISNVLNEQIRQLKETHRRLFQAHEELKSAQLKLIQTAKLESIGRLAAGLAHEVKNPLAVIQLGVDYLVRAPQDTTSPDAAETIREMGDAVRRADRVIKGLLNFSRSEELVLAPMDLNSVVEESLVLVRHASRQISLKKSLAASLPPAELDRNKVEQVFINVLMNAIQAMGDHGELSVETFRLPRGAATGNGSNSAAGSVVVEIKDTGHGIPADKEDKLFEPFFSTKPVGSGTGLGLSVSRKIIELHRGTIHIANRKEIRGVAVTIAFPVSNQG
jgi:signal transduction histidine kinase